MRTDYERHRTKTAGVLSLAKRPSGTRKQSTPIANSDVSRTPSDGRWYVYFVIDFVAIKMRIRENAFYTCRRRRRRRRFRTCSVDKNTVIITTYTPPPPGSNTNSSRLHSRVRPVDVTSYIPCEINFNTIEEYEKKKKKNLKKTFNRQDVLTSEFYPKVRVFLGEFSQEALLSLLSLSLRLSRERHGDSRDKTSSAAAGYATRRTVLRRHRPNAHTGFARVLLFIFFFFQSSYGVLLLTRRATDRHGFRGVAKKKKNESKSSKDRTRAARVHTTRRVRLFLEGTRD